MKELKVADAVIDADLMSIIVFHSRRSTEKAKKIVEEYDRAVAAIRNNLSLHRQRAHGWRLYIFRSGTYLLYYRELPDFWLVAGIFHASRDPDWILSNLLIREIRELGD